VLRKQDATLSDLRARISVLETALRALRGELEEGRRSPTPRSDFHALRFRVGALTYAVPIDAVREVIRYVRVTPVADVAEVVAGAIDVAGELVPIVDARIRFGQPVAFRTRGTAIVLLSFRESTVGLIVDGIEDVVLVSADAVTSPGAVLTGAVGPQSVAALEGAVVQVLDVADVLTSAEWESMWRALDTDDARQTAERPTDRTDAHE
jgi:purine-binding chemotaxis protein CheW